MRNSIVALVLGVALVAGGIAFAGEDVPAGKVVADKVPADVAPVAKPVVKTDAAPEKPATATPSPIMSMMKWVAGQVSEGDGCGCPTTDKGAKQWTAWFAAKDGKLAGLRTAMIADGWKADNTVAFFKKMAAAKKGGCDKAACDKAACDKGACDKAACDKAKANGASAPTGDAGASGTQAKKGSCCGKDKACDKGACDKSKDCKGCDKSKSKQVGASAATGDAGTTGAPAKDGACPCPCGKDK